MSRSAARRRFVPATETLVFLTTIVAILAIGVVVTHEKTPTALTTPTIAVAAAPCQEQRLSVGWRVGPLDTVTIPEVTGLVLSGLRGACDGLELTVRLLDEAGEPIAEASAVPSAGAARVEVAFEESVPIPPIADLEVLVMDTSRLSVAFAGAGAGRVDSLDGAIACPPNCSVDLPVGEEVTLRATPDPGSAFMGWSGVECLSGDQLFPDCEILLDVSAATAVARFEPAFEQVVFPEPGRRVDVSTASDFFYRSRVAFTAPDDGRTRGIVVRFVRFEELPALDGGVEFEPSRARVVDISVVYSDTGEPVPGPFDVCVAGTPPERLWHDEGVWFDVTNAPPADYVDGRVCGVVEELSPFIVAPYRAGTIRTVWVYTEGEGRVVSEPPGLDCPDEVCELEVSAGSLVRLTALPAPGWIFRGWTDSCEGLTGACLVRPGSEDVFVGAIFSLGGPPVILTPPRTQIAIAGRTASFTVRSDGPADNYRWRTRMKLTERYSDTPNGRTETLRWVARPADDGRRFVVIVGNARGTTVSREVRLWIASVESVGPTSGPVGRSVKIVGHRLTGATRVTFGGVASPRVIVIGSTIVLASVPAGATTGSLRVTIPAGTLTAAARWTIQPGRVAPFIRAILVSGDGRVRPGSVLTLYGRDFVGVTRATVGGVSASFRVASGGLMRIVVPAGATTFRVVIASAGGSARSGTGARIQ